MIIVGLIIVLVVAVAIALSIVKKKKGDDVADECAKGDVKAISEEKDTKQSQANPSQQTSETKAVEPEKTQVEINKNVQPLMSEDEIKEILANREHPEAGSLPYILVAEDNMSNYKLIEVMLRNIAVTENAVNGKKAVERAKKVAYDMISEEKQTQELNSLRNIPDSFMKIVIVNGTKKPWRNDEGFVIMGMKYFLLNADSLEF